MQSRSANLLKEQQTAYNPPPHTVVHTVIPLLYIPCRKACNQSLQTLDGTASHETLSSYKCMGTTIIDIREFNRMEKKMNVYTHIYYIELHLNLDRGYVMLIDVEYNSK